MYSITNGGFLGGYYDFYGYYHSGTLMNYDEFYDTFVQFWFAGFFDYGYGLMSIVGIILIICSCILKKNTEKYELIVTGEKIYGKLARGKSVIIPLNQIIDVVPFLFKGISIKTIDNTSTFYSIQNRDEVLKTIVSLLDNSSQMSIEKANGEVERLKSLKSLLDANIITQEEFEMKKKEIL